MRMRFTASRSPPGNWPSVMRTSRATTSICSERRPAASSTAPSSDRKATTPPPAEICKPTLLSPIASASAPPDFSLPGNCSAEMPGAKLTGLSFAAAKIFSSAARCVLGMPASRTFCFPSASGLRESQISSVATSEWKPRSASICKRLAASVSGSGGSSVCAVKTHFSGTPKMQLRSRTPAASSWLRISRPTSSGAAVSGSSASVTENFCNTASEPLVRLSTTPSSRPPSSARPSSDVNFFCPPNLNLKSDFIACPSRPNLPAPFRQAPSRAGSSPADIKFLACRRSRQK